MADLVVHLCDPTPGHERSTGIMAGGTEAVYCTAHDGAARSSSFAMCTCSTCLLRFMEQTVHKVLDLMRMTQALQRESTEAELRVVELLSVPKTPEATNG